MTIPSIIAATADTKNSRLCPEPGPFCGSEFVNLIDLKNQPGEAVVMACGDCGAIGPFARDDATAARLWNERANAKACS